VGVGFTLIVCVGVIVGVSVIVSVGVSESVSVIVSVGVSESVSVIVSVGVSESVSVIVSVGVSESVSVIVYDGKIAIELIGTSAARTSGAALLSLTGDDEAAALLAKDASAAMTIITGAKNAASARCRFFVTARSSRSALIFNAIPPTGGPHGSGKRRRKGLGAALMRRPEGSSAVVARR
jgi:hypothetical protein